LKLLASKVAEIRIEGPIFWMLP